jgi:hypothetical protein
LFLSVLTKTKPKNTTEAQGKQSKQFPNPQDNQETIQLQKHPGKASNTKKINNPTEQHREETANAKQQPKILSYQACQQTSHLQNNMFNFKMTCLELQLKTVFFHLLHQMELLRLLNPNIFLTLR